MRSSMLRTPICDLFGTFRAIVADAERIVAEKFTRAGGTADAGAAGRS
jgi:hypothetical protein